MSGLFQAVSSVVDSLFGGGERPQATPAPVPTPEPVTPMPSPTDATTQAARRRSIAEQLRRRGRASTILTSDVNTSEPLGG